MMDYYQITKEIADLFNLLEDRQSKNVFLARLKYDIEPSLASLSELFCAGARMDDTQVQEQLKFREHMEELHKENKKVFLYGTGASSKLLGRLMIAEEVFFSGFCSRNAEHYKEGIFGKLVWSHKLLVDNAEDCFLIIPTAEHYCSAVERLKGYGFPEERILPYFCGKYFTDKKPYFEFPELFRKGEAFVDGGCYDGATSLEFAEWCNGEYSKIFAFEPDQENIGRCNQAFKDGGMKNILMCSAGLGKTNEKLAFASGKGHSCYVVGKDKESPEHGIETINIVGLDNTVGEEKIGFIKLDIEGAEYDALVGAQNTIVRDKPLLAICVYHKDGDQLVLMDYLHSLVPEYKFWLRHYSASKLDTVLYAGIVQKNKV